MIAIINGELDKRKITEGRDAETMDYFNLAVELMKKQAENIEKSQRNPYTDLDGYDKWKDANKSLLNLPYCPICGKIGHRKCGRESR
ncbi:MAG: hypothetical protein A2W17_01420 [Planctomycetes bacterium RBG_16_41_13]|nr:MAG: hypothetical protein A2W17_01420 [Planctomycetes bacterium RBG_16_41_13]